MPSAIVRFRPTGPWRFGPDSGTRDRVDLIFHSDSLYAAVTSAMLRLEVLDEWLDATARRENGEPEVRFSSLFPFQRDILYVTPPRSLWPPPPSTKIRFKSARFVPLTVVQSLVAEKPVDENRWIIDGESQCLIPSGEGPFRIGLRSAAAVDRLNSGATSAHVTACIEFTREAGLWAMVVFSDDAAKERWQPRVASALRLLADSGFGGERSRGWGRSKEPEWRTFPELWPVPEAEKAYWVLGLYAPAESDAVDWKAGNYSTLTRTGRIESAASWGELKSPSVMIAEGSVLVAPSAPRGEARNVAPEGFAHAVFRAGFGVTIPIPWRVRGAGTHPVEQASRVVPAVAPGEVVVPSREPEPVVPTPEPAEPTPAGPTPQREPVVPGPTPEPVVPSPTPEPVVPKPEPQPVVPSPTPEPVVPQPASEPVVPSPTPEPVVPKPEPAPIVPKPATEPVVPAPKPGSVGPTQSEPVDSGPHPEPVERPSQPEHGGTPTESTSKVETVLTTPQPQPVIPNPGPEPVIPQPDPDPVIPNPDPGPVIPNPDPGPAVPMPQPEPDPNPEPVVPMPDPQPEPHTPEPAVPTFEPGYAQSGDPPRGVEQ